MKNRPLLLSVVSGLLVFGFCMSGCRYIDMKVTPADIRQGDKASIRVSVGEISAASRVEYTVNGTPGELTCYHCHATGSSAGGFVFDTCSRCDGVAEPMEECLGTGKYEKKLVLSGKVTYDDGEVRTFGPREYDLTVARASRGDPQRNYGVLIAHGDDEEDAFRSAASAFADNFTSYARQYKSMADPGQFNYRNNSTVVKANSTDLTLFVGHGSAAAFYPSPASGDFVATLFTAYGKFSPCYRVGELKYLALESCSVLDMSGSADHPFWYYWFNEDSTKCVTRPFAGLHEVLGFRTITYIDDDFLETFADNLDARMSVLDAWMNAAEDELSFEDGADRAAVLYLAEYEHDSVDSAKDDYTFGNAKYNSQVITYFVD